MRIFPIFTPFAENPRVLTTETEIRMSTYNLWFILYRSAKLQFRNRPRGYEILDLKNPCTFFKGYVPSDARHGTRYRAERFPGTVASIARHVSSKKSTGVFQIKYFISPRSISSLLLGRAVKDKSKFIC